MTEVTEGPRGLGGWLILPAIGLFVLPIRLLISLNNDILPIFQEGYWQVLTTPGSEAYHHLWAPLIVFEITANTIFIIFDLILIFLFFTKSYRFPKLLIIFLILNLLFLVADFFFSHLIPAVAEENDRAELVHAIIGAAIWIPYFMVSKRVKNTFVKPESNIALQPNFFEEIVDGEKVRVYDGQLDTKEDGEVEDDLTSDLLKKVDVNEVLRMIQDDPIRKWTRWLKYIFSAIIIWPLHLLLMLFVLVFSLIKGLVGVKK